MVTKLVCLALLVAALICSASAASWSGSVVTNSSSWSIYRQSQNLSFEYTQSVEGTISPLDFHGQVLSPYQSYYADVDVNDVRLKERTSAYEGSYRSEERIRLRAEAAQPVYLNVNKPTGSPVYDIRFAERWPVLLKASRSLDYAGRGINDREFSGNNLDYVGTSSLYNHELIKYSQVILYLEKMNATVQATDDAILEAEFMPTRDLYYNLSLQTTGIADLKYRQTDSGYDVKQGYYPPITEGEERYYGTYEIVRSVTMKANFTNVTKEDEWLPCCFSSYKAMPTYN